ncbi:MAG: DUF3445 domain-containing protein [Candidatus Latescibacteria bacterium]|nr:DUF3445 domain-containing protein [Candidatus Latescibacterota bacterium]
MNPFPEALPVEADPTAARYFPPAEGVYQVKPGFIRLGQDLGNGPADALLFQLDQSFPLFRQAKLQARAERLDKYYQTSAYPPEVAGAVARFIIQRLAQEHPTHFQLEEDSTGAHLHCALTAETLHFDSEHQLVGAQVAGSAPVPRRRGNDPGDPSRGVAGQGSPRGWGSGSGARASGGAGRALGRVGTGHSPTPPCGWDTEASADRALGKAGMACNAPTYGALPPTPPYTSALDALACQIQEDLAVVCRRADGSDWLAAVHLCCPNHWAAEEKVGRDFAQVHAPVAGMGPLNQRSADLIRAMIERGPYVRFAWGLGTDTRLNHHPEPPPGIPSANWQGRHFDPETPRLFVRVERQVLWGFPQQEAALFTIRTYFRDCARLTPQERTQLGLAIASMSPETLAYKGLVAHRDPILEWLA